MVIDSMEGEMNELLLLVGNSCRWQMADLIPIVSERSFAVRPRASCVCLCVCV